MGLFAINYPFLSCSDVCPISYNKPWLWPQCMLQQVSGRRLLIARGSKQYRVGHVQAGKLLNLTSWEGRGKRQMCLWTEEMSSRRAVYISARLISLLLLSGGHRSCNLIFPLPTISILLDLCSAPSDCYQRQSESAA